MKQGLTSCDQIGIRNRNITHIRRLGGDQHWSMNRRFGSGGGRGMKGWRGENRAALVTVLTHSSAVQGDVKRILRASTGIRCAQLSGGVPR